jgi:hypothetical protein
MSVADVEPVADNATAPSALEEAGDYRVLNRPAVASLALAVLSIPALLFPTLLVLPIAGIILGLIAIRSIKRYPEEWSGSRVAHAGVIGCMALAAAGAVLHVAEYAMEVPEGYERISFYELQPDTDRPDLPVPPKALELDGKRVFVKGFVYPDGQQNNIRRFVLVPDRGTCCFGGQPKLTDMIEVSIVTDDRLRYSLQMRKLAGTLHVDTRLKPVTGLGGVYYRLDADYVK